MFPLNASPSTWQTVIGRGDKQCISDSRGPWVRWRARETLSYLRKTALASGLASLLARPRVPPYAYIHRVP